MAMFLFIALPLVSVVSQSLHVPHEKVLNVIENCDPFGCTSQTQIDHTATEALYEAEPLGKWAGLGIYFDRGHLAVNEVSEMWRGSSDLGEFFSSLKNLPFYRAMGFTLTFTFLVTPFVILFGFLIALAVNSLHQRLKGLMIFFSLLPMIVN